MANCKPGDLARIRKPYRGKSLLGLYVNVVRASIRGEMVVGKNGYASMHHENDMPGWLCDANHAGFPRLIADCALDPIRDNPGNEQFVVESRRSLPRKKPVTGPVTINERGEVA